MKSNRFFRTSKQPGTIMTWRVLCKVNGIVRGWNKTLERYQKSYPSKEHTGTLKFVINDISEIEKGSYYVMGEYYLSRSVGDTNGIFMIIFKKIKGEWKIIADTSC